MDYKSILTTCPYCGCGCGLYLQVLDGKLIGTLPAKTHPASKGKLCIKGWNAHAFVQHKERLTSPLIKRGQSFEPASWGEVLSFVCNEFNRVKHEYGPTAFGMLSSAKCTNEENFVAMKFARIVLGTNNIDHCARLCHAPTVVGLGAAFGSGAMTNSISEIKDADCILVTGSNTLEQHPLIGAEIMNAKERGAKLIVIDPRFIPLAKFADIYLQPIPGSDVAWLNGLMNVIISEGLVDEAFIASRTEGYAALKDVVAKYTPEVVERITRIPAERLAAAAKMYGSAEKAMIFYSMGITQHITGTDNVMAIANLALLTGNVGRESTGVNPLRGQNNVQGACDMGALPNVYSGYQKITDPEVRAKFEQFWKCSLPTEPGLTVVEMLESAFKGEIKAMYVIGENAVLSDPDTNHTKKALEKLEFLVVQDIFLTETAEIADVVLPGATFAEKEGTFTSTDRRIERVRAAVQPLGETKPDWWIICELAKRMGSNQFNYSSPSEIMTEIAALTPIYGGISYARLDRGESLSWPCPDATHPGTKFLHKNQFIRGKGKFHAIEYKPPAELPDEHYPFLLTTGRVSFHFHTGTMTRRTKLLQREMPTGFVELHPSDAEKFGIKNGEKVKVESRRGELEIKAQITDRTLPGVVFIPFHFAECAANILTLRELDPVSKIPEFKVCAVNIKRCV